MALVRQCIMRVMVGDCSVRVKFAALSLGIRGRVYVFRRGGISSPTKLTDLVVGTGLRDCKEKNNEQCRFLQRVAAHYAMVRNLDFLWIKECSNAQMQRCTNALFVRRWASRIPSAFVSIVPYEYAKLGLGLSDLDPIEKGRGIEDIFLSKNCL